MIYFVVVGRGETTNDAIQDHNTNLEALLYRCAKKMKLNQNNEGSTITYPQARDSVYVYTYKVP